MKTVKVNKKRRPWWCMLDWKRSGEKKQKWLGGGSKLAVIDGEGDKAKSLMKQTNSNGSFCCSN